MRLGYLQDVYERPGPFATVYLDTSADTEDASKSVELRWRSSRERLAEQGADEPTLRALDEHVGEHRWRRGRRGQVLVAQQGEVVLSDELPQPPVGISDEEAAYFGPVPHLTAYLRLRGPRIPYVVATVDQAGAEIRTVHATREAETVTMRGEERSAQLVAGYVTKQAMSIGAKAIVLSGDVQQRQLVHEQLGNGVQNQVVETDASDEALQHQITETVEALIHSRISEAVQEFEQQRGERDRAVEGWQKTLEALRREQVRTLLWSGPVGAAEHTVKIGSRASEVAADDDGLGAEPVATVPASTAVVRALVGASAELILVDPEKVELVDGIGGVLRYSTSGA